MTAKNIGIVSLGLIGGSLLKVLSKNKDLNIYAVTRNPQTIEDAKEYTKNISDDLMTLKNCDVIFVCSPMNKTLQVLDALEKVAGSSAIVADVCSLKEFVIQKERPFKFIGTHPMAGTENSGFEASFDELFKDAKWVITPSEKTQENDVQQLKEIIVKTGANTVFMTPEEHDKAAAVISHMPMLLAQALMKTVMPNSEATKIASSGFRDMTRLALSNTDMANDMISMNSKNITTALISLIENAKNLLDEKYLDEIKEIKNFRKDMYNAEGKSISN